MANPSDKLFVDMRIAARKYLLATHAAGKVKAEAERLGALASAAEKEFEAATQAFLVQVTQEEIEAAGIVE